MRRANIINREINCEAEHTKHQPPGAWICPNCGGIVYTDRPALHAEPVCGQLHRGEIVQCKQCGTRWEGWSFAAAWEELEWQKRQTTKHRRSDLGRSHASPTASRSTSATMKPSDAISPPRSDPTNDGKMFSNDSGASATSKSSESSKTGTERTQIPVDELIEGRWYVGRGRNANVARWSRMEARGLPGNCRMTFLTIGFRFHQPDVKDEGYYGPEDGCFQPFALIDEGTMIESIGTEKGWDTHYAKKLNI